MLHQTIIVTFSLLAVIVLFAGLATRLHIPYAILLVLGGILLGVVPTLPDITLEPDLVLLLFLPPLIFSSAWFTSWRNFRRELIVILLLAIGLVLLTMLCVAEVVHLLIPGISWPVAFVLGAIVAPTDTVAANAILKTTGVSRRITTIIEGESLVNDATALVCYTFAIAAVTSGHFSLGQACLQFVLVSAGGILIGLIVAWPVAQLQLRLEDSLIQIAITILTPYAVYLLAEQFGASGVLAAVVAGLYLGRRAATYFSADTRLRAESFWNVLVFIFNGFIFLLVGLQLHPIIITLSASSLFTMIGYAGLISLTVILVRLVLPFLVAPFSHLFLHTSTFSNAERLIIGWTGMRGGISLATALAIPTTISNGSPFPARSGLIFSAFCVILSTLLLQGLTLTPLIHWLGVDVDPTLDEEQKIAEMAIAQVAIECINAENKNVPQDYVQHLRAFYQAKQRFMSEEIKEEELAPWQKKRGAVGRLLRNIRRAQRAKAIELRDTGQIDDEVFRQVEYELDLEALLFYHRRKFQLPQRVEDQAGSL